MAASKDQLCRGKGKSCRTTGILWASAASHTRGYAFAQSGHSRSSNITMATFAPRGGFNAEASAAKAQALKPSAASKIRTRLIDTLMNDPKFQEKLHLFYVRTLRSHSSGRGSEMKLKAAAQRA